MSKLLKFTAKMQNGSLKANFMGNQRSVDADANYVFSESEPTGQVKSFEFSFDDKGKLLPNGSGENPFNLVVDGPTNPFFQSLSSGERVATIASLTEDNSLNSSVGKDVGGLCGCPDNCQPCDE